ncbi:MAG TPA: hypothetical protein VHN55_07615 [Sphingomicrobium sp.]|nr:hypothetical protein [Sphingomicrobium sp.]
MRAILLILILAVVVLLIAFATGLLDIRQTRGARAPDIDVNSSGVTARGGQTPTFDIETGTVAVGTESRNVKVPTVRVDSTNEVNQQAENVTANAE